MKEGPLKWLEMKDPWQANNDTSNLKALNKHKEQWEKLWIAQFAPPGQSFGCY